MSRLKRASIFVNWSVQGALIGRTIFHWIFFLFSLAAVVILFHFLGSLVAGEVDRSNSSILQEVWDRHQLVFIALVALVPFFCLDLILWSHRFAGPMIRIRRSMRDLAEGKSVSPVHLRSRDYWKNLADDFNLLLRRLEQAEKHQSDSQAIDEVARTIDAAMDAPPVATAELQHS